MVNLPETVNKTMDALARQLAERRRAAGLSQLKLSELTGVKQGTISQIERRCHDPYLHTYLTLLLAVQAAEQNPDSLFNP